MRLVYIVPHPGITSPNKVLANIIEGAILNDLEIELLYLKSASSNAFEKICPIRRLSLTSPEVLNILKRADLIHSQGFLADLFSFIVSKVYKKKFLSTVHSIIHDDLKDSKGAIIGTVISYIWYKILKNASCVVCLNHISLADLQFRGSKNVMIIPNAIESETKREAVDQGIIDKLEAIKKSGSKILIASAVVRKLKGFDFVIESISHSEDWVFVLLGDGEYLIDLKKRYGKEIENGRFVTFGFVSQPFKYYRYADVFVMASYFEGFPMSLLEAIREEIPVICVIEPCFEGMFTENEVVMYKRNRADLLKAIEIAYDNQTLSATAMETLKSKYSIEKQRRAYLCLYNSLASK